MQFSVRSFNVFLGALFMAVPAWTNAATPWPQAIESVAPAEDAFYKAPASTELASKLPGAVLRFRTIPGLAYGASIAAYQLMFRTTDQRGRPAAGVTTVLVPSNAPEQGGRVLSYHAYYDSLVLSCSPSYLTVRNKLFERHNVWPALRKGIVVLLTDYEGLDSQWFAGRNTAHTALDGVRAVLRFPAARLRADAPVGLFGYSGGGLATAWAAELAPTYAPELNIVGGVYGSVAVNPDRVAKRADGGLFAGVTLSIAVGLSRAYPEMKLDRYLNAAGKQMVEDIGERCYMGMFQGEKDMLFAYAFKQIDSYLTVKDFFDLPSTQAVMQDNRLGQATPTAPLFVNEGIHDQIMPISDVDKLVAGYCAKGAKVLYHRNPTEHVLGGVLNQTQNMNYVLDRLDGVPAPNNCP